MSPLLSDSESLRLGYEQCRALARRTAQNFYYSFLVLPKPKRWAMCALYAFLRRTDDIGDSALPIEERRRELQQWRMDLDRVLSGNEPSEPWWLAFRDTVARYQIPTATLLEVVDGVESDLEIFRYSTFEDLYRYCYRVASAVGLACIRIWGATDKRAELPAEWCGIAFQMTNVLRDVVEDYQRGRLYLPQEDLDRFGVSEQVLADRRSTPEFESLVLFEVERARDYFQRSAALSEFLPPSGRAIFSVMRGLYGGLLDRIAESPSSVLQGRVRLGLPAKLACVMRALPIRYLGARA